MQHTRLCTASLVLNILLVAAVIFFWATSTSNSLTALTQDRTCQQIVHLYTAQYAELENQLELWDDHILDTQNWTDAERELFQKVSTLDSRAGILAALCEAPLTEQTPFDPVPTVTNTTEIEATAAETE